LGKNITTEEHYATESSGKRNSLQTEQFAKNVARIDNPQYQQVESSVHID